MKLEIGAKVLVTGSEGFIGKHLVRALVRRGCEVWGLGRRSQHSYYGRSYHYVLHDLKSPFPNGAFWPIETVDLAGCCVFHLAGETEHDKIEDNPSVINVGRSTTNMALALSQACCAKAFVFASSGKVYGTGDLFPTPEVRVPNPTTNLGRMKLACEQEIVRRYKKISDCGFVCARLSNIYGPGQRTSFLIPSLIHRITDAIRRNVVVQLGNLSTLRDYLFVTDAVEAMIQLAERSDELLVEDRFLVANVGSGKTASPLQIAMALAQMIDPKDGQNMVFRSDHEKRRREVKVEVLISETLHRLGWSPKVSLRRGLELCVEASKKECER